MRTDSSSSATTSQSSPFPPGWVVEPQTDGSVRVVHLNPNRARDADSAGALTVWWLVTFVLLLGLGYIKLTGLHYSALGVGQQTLVNLTLVAVGFFFPLLGLSYISDYLWGNFGTEEWLAGHQSLERRSGWSFSQRRRKRHYTQGVWRITQRDTEYQRHWYLYFNKQYGQYYYLPIWQISTTTNQGTPDQLYALGAVLSQATGWPLELPASWEEGRA